VSPYAEIAIVPYRRFSKARVTASIYFMIIHELPCPYR